MLIHLYEAIIIIFSVSLPLLNIYKFCKEEIFDLTTPGEPREQQLGEVRTKKVELKKFHKTQNYWKGSIYEYFSKMRQTSRTCFFSIVVKLNIFVITKATILIFLVNLPKVNIYKFPKKEILIQPPGEPREQHLGDVRPKKFELHKISIKNFN